MTYWRSGSAKVAASLRLSPLIPPGAAVPMYGMTLARPERDGRRSRTGARIPDGLEATLAQFSAGWRDAEPRAVATQFSKYWFRAAIPPTLVCAAAGRAAPDIALDRLDLKTDESGIPHLVAADDPAIAAASADGAAVMDRLFADHLEPIVAMFAAHSGLAPRVFWSNAATVIAWYLDQIRELPATGDGASTIAARWTDAASHPRFPGRNPIYKPLVDVRDEAGRTKRQRRVCCARYLSTDLDVCESCPLSNAPAARTAKR